MHRWLFFLFAALGALASATTAAQEPPTPIRLTLTETAPGAFRIDVQPAGPVGAYTVRALVSPIGSDQGVVIDLGKSDGAALALDLPLPLDGMQSAGCYHVNFDVTSGTATKPDPSLPSAGLITRACVDASGRITFPAFDSVTTPPPPPPSDVRIVPVAGIDGERETWRIEWRDNSTDEIAFDAGIVLLDKPWESGGSAIAGVDIPEVAADSTSIGSIGDFFTPNGPREHTCGSALVLVFAIGPDSPSIWPGTASVPACFSAGKISFPDAGDGADPMGDSRAWILVAMMCALGGAALLLLATARSRRSL